MHSDNCEPRRLLEKARKDILSARPVDALKKLEHFERWLRSSPAISEQEAESLQSSLAMLHSLAEAGKKGVQNARKALLDIDKETRTVTFYHKDGRPVTVCTPVPAEKTVY